MASDFSCVFTERAERDLDEILGYITDELKNPSAAAGLGEKIFGSLQTICSFPETGALVDNEYIPDKTVRRALVENYILYYKPDFSKSVIYVLRIVYGYRNLDAVFRPSP